MNRHFLVALAILVVAPELGAQGGERPSRERVVEIGHDARAVESQPGQFLRPGLRAVAEQVEIETAEDRAVSIGIVQFAR